MSSPTPLPPPPPLAGRDPRRFTPLYASAQPQEDPNSWGPVIRRRAMAAGLAFAMGASVGSLVMGIHAVMSRIPFKAASRNMLVSGTSFGTIFMVGSFIRQ